MIGYAQRLRRLPRRNAILTSLVLMGAAGGLAGCPAPGSEREFTIDAGPIGALEYREIGANPQPLPSGWEPTTEQSFEGTINGLPFEIDACIAKPTPDAENPDSDCVYYNDEGCDDPDGWRKICPEESTSSTPDIAGSIGSGEDPQPTFPYEVDGDVNYDLVTEEATLTYTTEADQPVPQGTVATHLAHPDAPQTFITPIQFELMYGAVMPVGTTVEIHAERRSFAYDAAVLGVSEGVVTTSNGDEYVFGFEPITEDGLLMAVYMKNGVVQDYFVVTQPD